MTEAPLNHPDDEALQALSLGQLSEADLAHVSGHLGDCPECCRRIDQLAPHDRLLARLRENAATPDVELVSTAQRRPAVRALRQLPDSGSARRTRDPEAVRATLPAPKLVGDYDILAEVGRGGMGVVYKARHRRLQRLAALKMVLAGEFASPTQELRFRLEAELAARVQHLNIVQVYEIGSYEGRPFLALEWVEGGSLANRLDGTPWPPDEAAALIETLARAIDVAHGEGIVHRDLKPANILLAVAGGARRVTAESQKRNAEPGALQTESLAGSNGPDGGQLPGNLGLYDGGTVRKNQQAALRIPQSPGVTSLPTSPSPLSTLRPKITDFGLAQTIEGGQSMTQSGFLVGTPGYMSPEQAAGKRALVGPATDIYALGVVLYQLVTGRLPFQNESTLELLRAITSDEPPRPRLLQSSVPRDLEAITLHCLEKQSGRRYHSALALADDLRRFQAGKQVMARPAGAFARVVRASRRRPLVTLLLALLTVSLFGGLGGIAWQWRNANEQRDLASERARQADDEKHLAVYEAYRASVAAASAALENHDVADADRHLELAPEALRGWEWRHLHSRLDDSALIVLLPEEGDSHLISAPDKLRLGVLTNEGLCITNLEGGEKKTVPLASRHQKFLSVIQTRHGLRLAAWIEKKSVELLDDTGKVLCHVATPGNKGQEPATVIVNQDATRLALRPDDRCDRLAVFDADSGNQTAVCEGNAGPIWTFTFSPDGGRLASGGEDRIARIWNAATGKLLASCQGHSGKIIGSAFSPDGSHLLTTSADGTVRQWNTMTGKEIAPPYDRHASEVLSAIYSPDGEWIASAGDDRTIRVWRARDRQDVAVLHGHRGRISEVAFAPGGRQLATLSHSTLPVPVDNTVRLWNVDPQAAFPVLNGHATGIYPVGYSPDGRWLTSGSWDKTARLWDAATGELCATLPHTSYVWDAAFGPDSSWLVTGCPHLDKLRIWDLATSSVRKEIPFNGNNFRSLALSPDGKRVSVGNFDPDQKIHLLTEFDIASGDPIFRTKGSPLVYSPDGRWLAILAEDEKTILLVDAVTHETAAQFSGHEKLVFKAAFSPDSRSLASCSRDHTVRHWIIDSGECRVLKGHTDEVYAVAFHPDGTRLATAGRDGTVWMWDLSRGKEVVRLPRMKSYVWSLAFSPDGASLASGCGDGTIHFWDTAPLKTRYQARRDALALRPAAERLVEQLWHEEKDPGAVVAALHADQTLGALMQQAATKAVLRRLHPLDFPPEKPRDTP